MPVHRLLSRTAIAAGAATLLAAATVGTADGAQRSADRSDSASQTIGGSGAIQRQIARSTFSAEPPEGTQPENLPPRRENVDLVSRLTLTGGPGGSIAPGQIADVAVFKDTAYLMSWSEPENCDRGGIFSVDISDPANPKELAFFPALPSSYHGEGAHALTLNTSAYSGDVLVANNEPCANVLEGPGGFTLYDVDDPANPTPLVQGFGDTGPEGTLEGDYAFANSAHSAFMWQDEGRAFVVIVDNFEATDVDIFEITDPRNPTPVGEFDFLEVAAEQEIDVRGEEAYGQQPFLHDMVVKEIDGRQTMLASYWDSGYMQVDIEDPANPRILSDNDFDGADPETGAVSREGNAHQAEYSADNRFILAADEDFAPYRAEEFKITTGPNAGDYAASEVGGGTSVAALPDKQLNGPTVYGGYGCPDPDGAGPLEGSDPIPPRDEADLPPLERGEEAIVVLQRGPGASTVDDEGNPVPDDPENTEESCFPGEKAAMAQAAGYDAVLIVNRHFDDPELDEAYCGSGGYPRGVSMVTLCTSHEAYHRIFGSEPNYDIPYPEEGEPERGDIGERILGTASYDGWGYAHLYDASGAKMREIDTYSIAESRDPRFAFGFGDLSIHEFATDPEVPLAYAAYYGGGFRALSFSEDGLKEEGVFIDDRGNNFWGVEQFTDAAGNRLIALADRDYGLYIVKYTGPGAVLAPPPAPGDGGGDGGGGAGGDGTPPVIIVGPGGEPPRGPQVVISANARRLSRTGVVSIRVRCPAEAGTACAGGLRLLSGSRRLGRGAFSIAPGTTEAVRVKWNKAARRLLRRKKGLRVQVIADARNAAGARLSNTARITVRPASAKLKSKRPR